MVVLASAIGERLALLDVKERIQRAAIHAAAGNYVSALSRDEQTDRGR